MWYDPVSGKRIGGMKRLRHWLFNFAAAVSMVMRNFSASQRLRGEVFFFGG
jgi:hypothetical protein